MIHSHPPDPRSRILFVLPARSDGPGDTEPRLLARHLDPRRHRIEMIPRAGTAEAPARLGVAADPGVDGRSFEDGVADLARRLPRYDLVVAWGSVPEVYPALARLAHPPPLVEHARHAVEALAGPKHLTSRHVGAHAGVRAAAATRMPGREHHALEIAPMSDSAPGEVAARPSLLSWQAVIEEVLAERPPAPPPELFQSFFQGGWEGSSHRLRSGRRVDVIAGTGHDANAGADYRQLARLGARTQRDGLRWHRVETTPGRYDFASWTPMRAAAEEAGVQVIWDLMHYGWPDDIDVWSPAFVTRFARFARAVAAHHRDTTDAIPFWCPINEISFLAWAGGDAAYLNPFDRDRGFELKVQLARATIAATREMRAIDPRARFVLCEPLIAVHHDPALGGSRADAAGWHEAQFQAADMIAGRLWPQLGGAPDLLDILGANYYPRNQWIHGGSATDEAHPSYQPLSDLLRALHARFDRPIVISETGTEGEARPGWFRMVAAEVARARRRGVPVEGICLYPIANHIGWDNDRLCPNGLLGHEVLDGTRAVEPALWDAIEAWFPPPTPAGPVAGDRIGGAI